MCFLSIINGQALLSIISDFQFGSGDIRLSEPQSPHLQNGNMSTSEREVIQESGPETRTASLFPGLDYPASAPPRHQAGSSSVEVVGGVSCTLWALAFPASTTRCQ